MFLYLILTCCQVRFTLLGLVLKEKKNKQRNSSFKSKMFQVLQLFKPLLNDLTHKLFSDKR